MKRQLADGVSLVFNPGCLIFMTLLMTVVLAQRSLFAWLLLLVVMALIASLILLIAWARGVVIDADLSTPINLAHRSQILLSFLSLILVVLIISFRTGQPEPLHAMFVTFLFLGCLVSGITRFFKISLHMLGVTTLVTTTLLLAGPAWWPISLLIPVIAWARLTLNRHTIWQVLAGLTLGFSVPALVFTAYGLV